MAFDFISKTVVGTNVATVTISSIPQTYKSLLIKARLKDYGNGFYETCSVIFNSDATNGNYDSLTYNNSDSNNGYIPVAGLNSSGTNKMFWSVCDRLASTFPNGFSSSEMLITNYSSTIDYKSASFFSANAQTNMDTNRITMNGSGYYKSNTGITSMTFNTGGTGIAAGTTFWLYGID
jgi:hypothetical protein